MAGSVCDLYFFEPGTAITPASGPENADGAVSTSVLTTSGLTPRFALNEDPPYSTRDNTSGNFDSLLPGTYTVNCRLSDSCMRELVVIIPYSETYAVKYRLQYDTITKSGLDIRFDIEQLSYIGPILYPEAGSEPVTIEWRNEGGVDVFTPIIGSSCTVVLNSRTEGEFDSLDTYNEKEIRGTFYVNGVQKWQGFMLPMNNEEEYNYNSNYDVALFFSDGLEDLAQKEFTDNSGNYPQTRISVMSAIIFCLNKTNLKVPIKDSNGIYPIGASTGSNSVLKQIFFDPLLFKNDDGTMQDCKTVLSSLLVSLGARILQADGYWHVESPTLKTGPCKTWEMAYDGGNVSNMTGVDYRIMLRRAGSLAPKITFMEMSGRKTNVPMYGAIHIVHDFGIDDNNLLLQGSFEDDDIGNGQLRDWQIDSSDFSPPVIPAEIILDTSKDHNHVLKQAFRLSGGIAAQQLITLTCTPVPVEFTEFTKLKLSFDVYTSPSQKDTYIEIEHSLSITGGIADYLMGPFIHEDGYNDLYGAPAIYNIDGEYLKTYIENHNEWKTITIETAYRGQVGYPFSGNLQVQFRIGSNKLYDYDSITSLRDEVTFTSSSGDATAGNDTQYNNRRRVLDPGTGSIRHYSLILGDQADDSDQYIRPNDYVSYLWKLDKIVSPPPDISYSTESWLRYILIDNVQVQYLPNGQEPTSVYESTAQMSSSVKNALNVSLPIADLPDDINYKNISKGWFSLSNGTPTSRWKLVKEALIGVVPSKPLIDLLTERFYRAQYQQKRRRLMGDVDCMEAIPYPSNTIYEVRTGKIYVIASCSFMTRNAMASLELLEALQGVPIDDSTPDPDPDVEPPQATYDFSPTDFSTTDFYAS